MQYVGRLVSTVYNSITPNINPATLSGAIDVIVVERQVETEVEEESEWGGETGKIKRTITSTELSSTPFHVRFGKMSVLRPAERKVTLHLNNSPDPLPFAMKVGEMGEAFFVLELGEDEAKNGIPDDLITSPIISAANSPVLIPDVQDPGFIISDIQSTPAPRKGLEKDFVEPLDLGAPRAEVNSYPPSDLESNEASTIRSEPTRASVDTGITSPSLHGINGGDDGEKRGTEEAVADAEAKEGRNGDAVGRKEGEGEDLSIVENIEVAASHASESVGAASTHIVSSMVGVDDDVSMKVDGRKDYMLDMDGYKMTSTDEDYAYAEGARFANELPLSRRHGGDGKHGHSEKLNRPHEHTPSQMASPPMHAHDDPREYAQERTSNIAPENASDVPEAGPFFDTEARQSSFKQETHTEKPPRPLDRSQTDSVLESNAAKREAAEQSAKLNGKKRTQTYAKTLRLTSDQLKQLNLRKGANTITFSVTSSFSGVATCSARIFLWDASHKVVVSDIDGTITKSDALGHVFTMIGRDWTHIGVAKLYTDIARNGYRIMYLTSRAIGQADTTRDYLNGITQNKYKLPDGPVIMSPDRLMASLHREVILRKPEVFKMACLRDIARLFGADPRKGATNQSDKQRTGREQASANAPNEAGAPKAAESGPAPIAQANDKTNNQHPTPFYAGFGNRITDALSYRSVNIPSSRIFTIDSNGEVKMELLDLAGYKSSYIHMTDLVDQMFPPITLKSAQGNEGKPEFNDFNYWRPQIGEFELPSDEELLTHPIGSSPASPALSARSVRSVRSNASIKSGDGGARQWSEGGIPMEEGSSSSRLSRFGLGKLSLNRKGSAQTIAAPITTSSDEGSGDKSAAMPQYKSTNDLTEVGGIHDFSQTPSSPSSYGSGVTSWAAGWRRRAASPGAASQTATSPLVGPVITAEPEDEDVEEGEADDDVSSFEGDREDEDDEDNDSQHGNAGEEGPDDDDPLLATGEIQFEWRG